MCIYNKFKASYSLYALTFKLSALYALESQVILAPKHEAFEMSTRHAIWTCFHAHAVWHGVCVFLSRVEMCAGFVTWGTISRLHHLLGPHMTFEGEVDDPVFILTRAGFS